MLTMTQVPAKPVKSLPLKQGHFVRIVALGHLLMLTTKLMQPPLWCPQVHLPVPFVQPCHCFAAAAPAAAAGLPTCCPACRSFARHPSGPPVLAANASGALSLRAAQLRRPFFLRPPPYTLMLASTRCATSIARLSVSGWNTSKRLMFALTLGCKLLRK